MHESKQPVLGGSIPLPEGVNPEDVSDGYHTFKELYEHRYHLFAALLKVCVTKGLDTGWSTRHEDGELCFGGGWVIAWVVAPDGTEARYHLPDTFPLPAELECPLGRPWNGKEETLDALITLAS